MKRYYIYKVWGSTVVAAPVLIMLTTAIVAVKQGSRFDLGAFGFIAFAIGYGLILSLPTFLVIYFLFPFLSRKTKTPLNLKLSLLVIGIVNILATFYLLYDREGYDLNENYAALTFSVVYSICLIIFGLIYPVSKNKVQPKI